jgi:hypothetical protein
VVNLNLEVFGVLCNFLLRVFFFFVRVIINLPRSERRLFTLLILSCKRIRGVTNAFHCGC